MRRNTVRLTFALVFTALVAALELWGGLAAHSLALITDAVHVTTDVLALGVALAAVIGAQRPANVRKTFGYGRLEILGALANGAFLLAVTFVVVYEAVMRLRAPVESHGTLMTIVAVIGLLVNLGIAHTLSHEAEENLNVRAALYHIFGDALGAGSVVVGGIIIARTQATWIDPVLSLLIAGIIVAGVARVLREAADEVLESVPRGVHIAEVDEELRGIEGVVAVHDLHIWSIGAAGRALSAHVQLEDRRISEATAVLREMETLLRTKYAITHVTLQFECEACHPDDRIICTQRPSTTP